MKLFEVYKKNIFEKFPFIAESNESLISELNSVVMIQKIEQNKQLSIEGDTCPYLAFVIEGVVRVYKASSTGREITLYRIEPGESCILTASCILTNKNFPANSITEEDLTVMLIPSSNIKTWISKYPGWQEFFFNLVSKRMESVLSVVEEIAFKRIDVRIADFLISSNINGEIRMTHQEIAVELGSVREVISRILKDFEKDNIIQISRGCIVIRNNEALKQKSRV